MKWYHPIVVFPFLVLLALTGCTDRSSSKTTVAVDTKKGGKTPSVTTMFQIARDTFRYPENPQTSDDWARFHGGLQQLNNGYFSLSDVQARIRLAPEERKFLESEVHLTEDEFSEVEAGSFRIADAHYLDECFLLHDSARFLETPGLSFPEQVQRHFRWVMRNVYLHEQSSEWIPPAFVLRRGFGSALDRSLIFLALLRQSNIEGCLIVVPEAEPKQILVAALDLKSGKLLLFDARPGMPVLGKDGKSVATLNEVLENPKLLEPSLISAEDAKKLQAWLVCPLYALSPRMLELQRGLGRETVVLHLNAPQLHQEITQASKLPVKVWNPPAEGKILPNSPTRSLRQFLPKQDGGTSEVSQIGDFSTRHLPIWQTLINYHRIRLHRDSMPKAAFEKLQGLTVQLFDKYDLQVREMFLHGLFEQVLRRQKRLQAFVGDAVAAGLTDDKTFRTDLADWHNKIKLANPNAVDPKEQALAEKISLALWTQDHFLLWLLNLENEEELNRGIKKTIVTNIFAFGVRDHFDFELARYQAHLSQEKAERAQAHVQASEKPTKSALNKAHEGWLTAKTSWSNFYLDRIVVQELIRQRLKLIGELPRQDIIVRLNLLEQLHREIHLYFEARFRLAECIEHIDGSKAALVSLESTRKEIEELLKNQQLPREIQKVRDAADAVQPKMVRDALQLRLDLLARDWSERGSFFWMKQSLVQKTGMMSNL